MHGCWRSVGADRLDVCVCERLLIYCCIFWCVVCAPRGEGAGVKCQEGETKYWVYVPKSRRCKAWLGCGGYFEFYPMAAVHVESSQVPSRVRGVKNSRFFLRLFRLSRFAEPYLHWCVVVTFSFLSNNFRGLGLLCPWFSAQTLYLYL